MNSRVLLARNIQKDGLDRMSHRLAALPEREDAHAEGAEE